jgi:flagellar biogenesis protein FliO
MDSFFSLFFKAVYFLIVFGIIVVLAYYSTRILGKRVSANSGKYMRIVDTLFVGNDRTLIIVQVKDEFLLMSSSVKGIEIIKGLDDFTEDEDIAGDSFDGYLKKYGTSYNRGFFSSLRKKVSGRDETNDK